MRHDFCESRETAVIVDVKSIAAPRTLIAAVVGDQIILP
jgi:hypothetical protein